MADKVLFCLEEIERLNILVERAIERGTLARVDLRYAELEVQARQADRAAKVYAGHSDAAQMYRKRAIRLRQQLAQLELEPIPARVV